MSFILSKLVWALAAPGSVLLFLLVAALLLFRWRPRAARGFLVAATAVVTALAVAPVGRWAIEPLQTAVPMPSALKLDHVDGVIVLGGAIGTGDLAATGLPSLGDAAERMTTLVTLARRYPDARLIFTGGSGFSRDAAGFNEAAAARTLFEALGVDMARMQFEDASRNTFENAVFSQRLVRPAPGETWLLVTSAWHMPRALGCFRKAGWPVVPYAVDYAGREPVHWLAFDVPRELQWLSMAAREWIGLVSYRLMGRIDALLPRYSPGDAQGQPAP